MFGVMVGQANREGMDGELWFGIAMLGVGVMVVVVIAFYARRWWISGDGEEEGEGKPEFTLADLRRMRGEGQLTQEEFERMKQILIARAQMEMDGGKKKEQIEGEVEEAGEDQEGGERS